MAHITHDFVEQLPAIYQDILRAFPKFEPNRRAGYGLAFQSLFAALEEQRTLGENMQACEEMARANVVEIKDRFFVTPTAIGEQLITELTGHKPKSPVIPPFPPLPQ